MTRPTQTPGPGSRLVFHRGDTVCFTLSLPEPLRGRALLRTNIGNAAVRREEIVRHVENHEPSLACDWRDIPMKPLDGQHFAVTLALTEVGRFEAKALFLPEESDVPLWPEGENVVCKVEPASACCANAIYGAFVRQFGPAKRAGRVPEREAEAVHLLDHAGYTVIPRSGTFRDLIRELDFIMGRLRSRIIQLLPIHPVPTTYARMGRFGSPFASLDFLDVDPALAEFDRKTTPLDQFRELVDAVHQRCGKLFLDIPVNHTGWASRLQKEHPEWFARRDDRAFQSPGAWGVTWEDLSRLDYAHEGLWRYMADVFLFWCRHGVDGFRLDAGYMIPFPVWEYVVAKVRRAYPDTIFLLEGLGGKLEVMERLLTDANLDWAYSELFQNYDRAQIEAYLPGAIRVSETEGMLIHFAETHDNNRLAATSPTYARLRTALTALCSECGGFGITNGVEWLAREKLDVHGASSLNWDSAENQVDRIARLHAILESHPAFHAGARAHLLSGSGDTCLALVRRPSGAGATLLVLANLDWQHEAAAVWTESDYAPGIMEMQDLLTGRGIVLTRHGDRFQRLLQPGEVLCLTPDPADLNAVEKTLRRSACAPVRVVRQELQAKALETRRFFHGDADLADADPAAEARALAEDPRAFCLRWAEPHAAAAHVPLPPVTVWQWPRDLRRCAMVPVGHFLLIRAPYRFLAEIRDGADVVRRETSLPAADGTHFVLLLPLPAADAPKNLTLAMAVYEPGNCRREECRLLFLGRAHTPAVRTAFTAAEVRAQNLYAIATNGRGAFAQVRGAWGEIRTQYDALLAANLHPDVPVDRHVMLTRCRAWLVCRGYSHELASDSLESFEVDPEGTVAWRFLAPAGNHRHVRLDVTLRMHGGHNAVTLRFRRRRAGRDAAILEDAAPIRIIVRPHIEDRNAHGKTKAYTGPETAWPAAVTATEKGFEFRPADDRCLEMAAFPGTFTHETEWTYMVAHPEDAERGLDGASDLFSPGYFTLPLRGGAESDLCALVSSAPARLTTQTVVGGPAGTAAMEACRAAHAERAEPPATGARMDEVLRRALRDFLVKRDASQTVIAGYPWFLDWGRDTLICLRGYLAAGHADEAAGILRQFARFEAEGTLPNMIRGNDQSNRDTSDAPLWFFVACADLLRAGGGRAFLQQDCGGRTVLQVLQSIARHYRDGTPNGIRMDPDTALIFSPAHFTWMDTNFPAGTPREGYPVEIQALWHAALSLLARADPGAGWTQLAERVRASLLSLYWRPEAGFLSDCLHAPAGTTAAAATADDHLRPNQLLAITLGAVPAPDVCRGILAACEELLVPGAIRSLADRPVTYALPIRAGDRLLNDPNRPYWGRYTGDEDTRRKPAYHNGTAWTWLFPSYCEALALTFGKPARPTARALLSSAVELFEAGCIGHVPEIADGDAPHAQRGCGAQAWSATELYRVLCLLTDSPHGARATTSRSRNR